MKRTRVAVAIAGLAACGAQAPAEDDGDGVAPRLVATSPVQGATDVYPARLYGGMVPRVRIALRFDEAMAPDVASVTLTGAARRAELREATGAETRELAGAWSEDGTELVVEVVGSGLTSQPPLADGAMYEVDVGALRDRAGNRAVGGPLRFATGTFDPLLNHSCGHVFFGPYATASAAATASMAAPRTDAPHTRYTVAVPAGGGFTRLRLAAAATCHLFVDGDVPIALEAATGEARPVARAATPDACDGISERATFHLDALEEVYLHLGAGPEARFIVELVPDGT